MGPTRPYKRKPRGLPGALHLGWLCVVAFSAENRKSTFPENASFAWSHFLRKTGSPLFRKMLPLRGRIFCGKPGVHFSGKCFLCVGRIFCGKPGVHFSGKCFQRSEVAAV